MPVETTAGPQPVDTVRAELSKAPPDLEAAIAALPAAETDPLAAASVELEAVDTGKPDYTKLRAALEAAVEAATAAKPLTRATIPEDPKKPAWLLPDWLPADRIAFLSGRGGSGKSRLALQLAAATAAGQDGPCAGYNWLFADRERLLTARGGNAVIASWEDSPDVVGWRLQRLFKTAHGWPEGQIRERLHLLDMAALGPVWSPSSTGSGHTSTLGALTAAGMKLRAYAEQAGAALLVVDPLAAAFASNENDRGLVRQFMASWDAWAREHRCAVLLVSHPAKASVGEGAAYSGSTDWRNAARAAWLLDSRPAPDAAAPKRGEPQPEEYPCLVLDKSSYGPLPAGPRWLSAEETVWREVETPVAATNGGSDDDGFSPLY